MNYPTTKYIKKMAVKWAEERLLLPVIIVQCLGSERCFKLEVPKADIIKESEQAWAKKETPAELAERIKRMGERCGLFEFGGSYIWRGGFDFNTYKRE